MTAALALLLLVPTWRVPETREYPDQRIRCTIVCTYRDPYRVRAVIERYVLDGVPVIRPGRPPLLRYRWRPAAGAFLTIRMRAWDAESGAPDLYFSARADARGRVDWMADGDEKLLAWPARPELGDRRRELRVFPPAFTIEELAPEWFPS